MNRDEILAELKSTNLSMKLLNTVSSPPTYFKQSIFSLKELRSRISLANQNFNYKRTDRENAKQWMLDRGVNLGIVREVARQVKKKAKIELAQTTNDEGWQKFQYRSFDNLAIEDFLHCSEERIAYSALINSFNSNSHNTCMEDLMMRSIEKPKAKTLSSQKQRDISQKEIISQFINSHKALLSNNSDQSFLNLLENTSINKFLWFKILYYQIKMIECLGRNEPNKRNYILTVTLKQLEKNLIKSYNSRQYWKNTYLQYRKGGTNFYPSDSDFDNELLNNLIVLQQQVNNFEQISIQSSIDLNKNDDVFERVLKLAVLGKFEDDLLEQNILDQVWLLILTSGLKRTQNEEKQQRVLFRRRVKNFVSRATSNKIQSNEELDEILASFICLGAYDQILSLYKQHINTNSLLTQTNRLLFMQLFILLAFNPELLEEFNPIPSKSRAASANTKGLLQQILIQLAYFANSYKQSNFSLYTTLLVVITRALEIYQKIQNICLEALPDRLADILNITLQDLESRECRYLPVISSRSQLATKMFQNVLLNSRLESNEDYLKLAQLCRQFEISQLIEPLFLKFIIAHLLEPHNSVHQKSSIVQEILQQLNELITKQNLHLLHFLTNLMELRQLTASKNIGELTAKRKGFQIYLEDYRLLALLQKLSEREKMKLFDIYVLYYEQIYLMYKLVFLAHNNMTKLRKKINKLSLQLEKCKNRYPDIKSLRQGKLVVELQK